MQLRMERLDEVTSGGRVVEAPGRSAWWDRILQEDAPSSDAEGGGVTAVIRLSLMRLRPNLPERSSASDGVIKVAT
jgi:hypothetical protein